MWKKHPARAELLALYQEVDSLMSAFSCPASGECCHFARTGREPYPHAVELAEVVDAARAVVSPKTWERRLSASSQQESGLRLRRNTSLRVVDTDRTCPLLGDDGRCRIYASRPFGCRTYFCDRVEGPGKLPREELREIGRRIADLSARAFPRDPGPRALTKALA